MATADAGFIVSIRDGGAWLQPHGSTTDAIAGDRPEPIPIALPLVPVTMPGARPGKTEINRSCECVNW